ncbi:Cofactor assembly of complex C subunit B [Gracilaria domingensis]|nr:Cofactor assembly of complex C subunit B [Gracilaria domingensis]
MGVNFGRMSLITGGCLLTGLLGNRLILTPLDGLTATQSRADLLGVAASATLILYGLARTEISEKRARVEMGGVDVAAGFEGSRSVGVQLGCRALLDGVQGVKSVAVVVKGQGRFFMGKFRAEVPVLILEQEGVISKALQSGNRAYLADMKVVPVRETEFGFLPKECQSVLVQPVNEDVCVIVGADRPRPFTGQDFGWTQAICDRIGASLVVPGEETAMAV